MQRRLRFAFGLVVCLVALAGCVDAAGSISMEPVDDETLAERASLSVPSADDPGGLSSGVVREAIESESATIVAPEPPVRSEDGLPFRHEGRFYALSHAVVGSEPGYSASIAVDYNTSRAVDSPVAFADLPAADRERIRGLFTAPRDDRSDGYDFGVGVTYRLDEANDSVLVPDTGYDAVTYRGETYPIRVERAERTTLSVYRYEATLVAESPGAYAGALVDRYEFELAGLSAAETGVVDEALNDSYYAENTDDEGFSALVERFRDREAVTGDEYGGAWLVTYEGQRYWVRLDYGQFVTDAVPVARSPVVTPPGE